MTQRQPGIDTPSGPPTEAGAVRAEGPHWRKGVARLLAPPTGNPVHAIYGTVLTAALLAAEDPAHAQTGDIAASVLVTVVVFWLAHGYSHMIGIRLTSATGQPRFGDAWESLAEHWPMVQAATLPLAALLLARLAGATIDNAQEAGLWTSVALLAGWGYAAGRASHLRAVRLAAYALGSAGLGVLLVLLEVAIH